MEIPGRTAGDVTFTEHGLRDEWVIWGKTRWWTTSSILDLWVRYGKDMSEMRMRYVYNDVESLSFIQLGFAWISSKNWCTYIVTKTWLGLGNLTIIWSISRFLVSRLRFKFLDSLTTGCQRFNRLIIIGLWLQSYWKENIILYIARAMQKNVHFIHSDWRLVMFEKHKRQAKFRYSEITFRGFSSSGVPRKHLKKKANFHDFFFISW